MESIQTGTVLDNLQNMVTGESSNGIPKGSLIVLAGDPDADACLELSRKLIKNKHVSTLLADGTGTNYHLGSLSSPLVGTYSFEAAVMLIHQLRYDDLWDCIILHSLDTWNDWNEPGLAMELADSCHHSNLSVILHTMTMGEQPYFGDRILRPWADVALRVGGQGDCSYLGGSTYRL